MTKRTATNDIFSTWQRAVFDPAALYAGEDPERRRMRPLVFAIVVGAFASAAVALAEGGLGASMGAGVVGALQTICWVYLTALVTHLCLRAVGGGKGTFRDTVAAVCYARAPYVFNIVAAAGLLVGVIFYGVVVLPWSAVVLAVALKHARRTTIRRAALAAILGAGTPILFPLALRAFVVEAFKIPSGGMIPSLTIGDHLFVEKLGYGPFIPWTDARLYSGLPPRRGDVMVFKFPENKEQDFIKRAIALPGDTLEAINGRPVLDGWLVPHCHVGPYRDENRTAELFVEFLGDRDYLTLFDANPDEHTCAGAAACDAGSVCHAGICGTLQGPFKVAKDEVWVMGDNRNNTHDSRSWRGGLGAGVPFENIKGRATFVWMSFGPGGGIAQDRLFVSVNGRPVLPAENAGLEPALATCLRERPPLATTTPPRR